MADSAIDRLRAVVDHRPVRVVHVFERDTDAGGWPDCIGPVDREAGSVLGRDDARSGDLRDLVA